MDQMAKTQNNHNINYVPIPLRHASADMLSKIRIFLSSSDNTYNLYNKDGLGFNWKDHKRLTENGHEFVYITTRDFTHNYDLLCDSLQPILQDKSLALDLRVQFAYESTIALAKKIIEQPFSNNSINDAIDHSHKIINTLGSEDEAMSYLIKAANHKDHDVEVHMANNATLMMSFVLKAGLLEKNTLSVLGAGALLEDIGKILLPRDLLDKSEKLTEQERKLLENHVQLGINHLKMIDDLDDEILNIVKYHHERYDGSGYPEQLKKDQIPLMGQVAGLIDCFEAMISVRPYRSKPLSIEQALEEMETTMADQFDPDLLRCFSGFVKFHLLDDRKITDEEMLNCDISALRILDRKSNPSGRRHEREYLRKPGKVSNLTYNEDKWVSKDSSKITVYNVSRSGIGFLSQKPFEENKLVQIIVNTEEKLVPLVAKTVRTSRHQRDWYTVGASFLRTHTRNEFKKLMQQLDNKPIPVSPIAHEE